MPTISELFKKGHTEIKLPNWNEFAYLELIPSKLNPKMLAPWAILHDVNYAEKTMAWLGDTDDRWVPYISKEVDG